MIPQNNFRVSHSLMHLSNQALPSISADQGILNVTISFSVGTVEGDAPFIGINFSESSLWINTEGCAGLAICLLLCPQ